MSGALYAEHPELWNGKHKTTGVNIHPPPVPL